MSDSTSEQSGSGDRPVVSSFNPAHPEVPESLRNPAPEDSAVVVLLDSGADRRWAADTAIELCAAWAKGGRRIVLADLHLENPILHERVGGTNMEGVVDIFVYGASLARSARPVEGRGFYLISAGTYTPDADAIFSHPRWTKLITGFRDAGASLVLFVPEETADLTALGVWTRDVVVLGGATAMEAVARAAERGLNVRSALVPPGTAVGGGESSWLQGMEPVGESESFEELEQLDEYDGSADGITFPEVDFGWANPDPRAGDEPAMESDPVTSDDPWQEPESRPAPASEREAEPEFEPDPPSEPIREPPLDPQPAADVVSGLKGSHGPRPRTPSRGRS